VFSISDNEEADTMDTPISLTTQQVDLINSSLERALAIAELLVTCGPMENTIEDTPSHGSLTVVFQMVVEELVKIEEALKSSGK
jgi:hypothetical protein